MKREEKSLIIDELVKRFRDHSVLYFTDASGLTVGQINNFRKLCYDRGVEYKVFKNTLIKKALSQMDVAVDRWEPAILKGFTGIIFSQENGNLPARLIQDFRKKGSPKPSLKAAYIDHELFVGEHSLDSLINLKSKNELIADIIALLQSPAKQVISALQSGPNKIAGIIKTLSEKEN